MVATQQSLFGHTPGSRTRSLDDKLGALRRHQLDEESWVDHLPGWIDEHEAVFRCLGETTAWRSASREMYERIVEVPRLLASFPDDGPGHPLMPAMKAALERRYGQSLSGVSAALYRDGRDSVALHGDTWARALPVALVAIVSVGAPRRFVMRPVEAGAGRPLAFNVGWGDLLVMGGASQRRWLHGIPKAKAADPRMAIMFRQRFEPFEQRSSSGWGRSGVNTRSRDR
jgi:alkylated DNA repair dioxygenase AlkB